LQVSGDDDGGAIQVVAGFVTLLGATFEQNSAGFVSKLFQEKELLLGWFPALHCAWLRGFCVLTHCCFACASPFLCLQVGGAIVANRGSITITDTTFKANKAIVSELTKKRISWRIGSQLFTVHGFMCFLCTDMLLFCLCISIMFAEWWSHLCIPTSFFDNHSHHV
jgi:hypothetical protein